MIRNLSGCYLEIKLSGKSSADTARMCAVNKKTTDSVAFYVLWLNGYYVPLSFDPILIISLTMLLTTGYRRPSYPNRFVLIGRITGCIKRYRESI